MTDRPVPKPFKLCLYDDRRGQVEGQEHEKILAFYPSTASLLSRTSLIGFAQAMKAFTSVFDQAPCESILADKHTWALHSCEAHITLLLVADRGQLPSATTQAALKTVLQHMHNLLYLLLGSLSQLLQQQEGVEGARKLIQPVIAEFALYSLAALALLATRSPSFGKRLMSAASGRPKPGPKGQKSLLSPRTWQRLPSGFLVPLLGDNVGLEGSAASAEGHGPVRLASMWQEGASEPAGLLALSHGDALLLLIVPHSYAPDHRALISLANAFRGQMQELSRAAKEHFGAIRHGHVTGFRYVFEDALAHTTVQSPASKVATLNKDSLALASAVRGWAADLAQGDEEASVEVAARGQPHCWGLARRQGDNVLVLPLEQHKGDSLLESCAAAQKFADERCPGVFW
ncbi:hypothetical protein WJX73_002911 [Symbiochloris irregularis]|uniref:CCZ1/INTU/HSP4 first Longin domain-containing protein n=1 Tax=Symbiochloris irregularis TaxID=706552 RepID=A0AAW1NN74_9CHLO